MKRIQLPIVCFTLLVWLMPASTSAITLAEATRKAARQNNAKVLSAKTVQRGNVRTHHIKILTKKGVVRTVKYPGKKQAKKR
jgi:hypothetical protein